MGVFSTDKKSLRILVFAFPRTGSTTLAEGLGLFWRVKVILEPFNEVDGYATGREITGKDSLYAVLDEISSRGIHVVKHLNCQLEKELNCRLMEYGYRRVLFLWRRNALKRAVSNEMSFQSNEWRRDRRRILSTDFKPLDIEELKANIEWYRSEVDWYREFLLSRRINFREIVMEDFYRDSMEEKESFMVQLARECFPLRGLRCNRELLRKLLSPEVSRLNSPETYRLIPNIDEVNRELSGDDNGYLFE